MVPSSPSPSPPRPAFTPHQQWLRRRALKRRLEHCAARAERQRRTASLIDDVIRHMNRADNTSHTAQYLVRRLLATYEDIVKDLKAVSAECHRTADLYQTCHV